jgi:hypothetical protein
MKTILRGRLALIAFVCLLVTGNVGARATTLPDFTSSVTTYANSPTTTVTTDPTSVTINGPPGSPSAIAAAGSIAVSPSVNIQTQSNAVIGGVQGQSAESLLDYYFTVVGGTTGTPVTVDVSVNLGTTASTEPAPGSTAFYGFSEIDVGPTAEETVCTASAQCTNSSFNGTFSLTADVGDVVHVHFEVISESDTAFTGSATASATDPVFSVDSDTPNSGLYCIQLSAGVGGGSCEASATPLPGALPLFATGLGAMGLFGWRRKRRVAGA